MGTMKLPCWSCRRPLADVGGATCKGCGRIVCATCAQKYGHGNGRYAKQLKTVSVQAHTRRGYCR